MALFVKKTEEETEVAMIYSTGLGTTKLFVGLGNPGKEYAWNRHNVGFKAIDEFAKQNNIQNWVHKKDLKCDIAYGDVGGTRVIVAKPTTFMNESGQAMQLIANFYKLPMEDTVVVYDEVDIDFGKLQVRRGGVAAGHNGVKSLLQHNEDAFTRIRVGVGPKEPAQMDLANFVLKDFPKDQEADLEIILKEVSSMLGEATAAKLNPETRTVIF